MWLFQEENIIVSSSFQEQSYHLDTGFYSFCPFCRPQRFFLPHYTILIWYMFIEGPLLIVYFKVYPANMLEIQKTIHFEYGTTDAGPFLVLCFEVRSLITYVRITWGGPFLMECFIICHLIILYVIISESGCFFHSVV